MVQLRWAYLTESNEEMELVLHAGYAAAAPELFDTVPERLAEPSASGEVIDDQALSQRIGSESMTGEDFHPDVIPTEFPSESLTCRTTGWGPPWMYAGGQDDYEPPPSTTVSEPARITPDTTSGDAMSINQRIHIAGEQYRDDVQRRYISEMDIGALCDGSSDIARNDDGEAYASGPGTDKSYHRESRPYTENGWDGVIATTGTRCALGADAPIGKSAVEGFVVAVNGPLVLCVRVQAGGGDDLDAATAEVVDLLTEAIDAMPVS